MIIDYKNVGRVLDGPMSWRELVIFSVLSIPVASLIVLLGYVLGFAAVCALDVGLFILLSILAGVA